MCYKVNLVIMGEWERTPGAPKNGVCGTRVGNYNMLSCQNGHDSSGPRNRQRVDIGLAPARVPHFPTRAGVLGQAVHPLEAPL